MDTNRSLTALSQKKFLTSLRRHPFKIPIPSNTRPRRDLARIFRPVSSRIFVPGLRTLGLPNARHGDPTLLVGQPSWYCSAGAAKKPVARPRETQKSGRLAWYHRSRPSFAVNASLIRRRPNLSRGPLHYGPLRRAPGLCPHGHFGGSLRLGRWRTQIQRPWRRAPCHDCLNKPPGAFHPTGLVASRAPSEGHTAPVRKREARRYGKGLRSKDENPLLPVGQAPSCRLHVHASPVPQTHRQASLCVATLECQRCRSVSFSRDAEAHIGVHRRRLSHVPQEGRNVRILPDARAPIARQSLFDFPYSELHCHKTSF